MGLLDFVFGRARKKRQPRRRPARAARPRLERLETRDAPAGDLLTPTDVQALIQRAEAASASNDAIVAVVDRGGRVLGVSVENGVSPAITGNTGSLVFAIDGALALARTGAFFSSNQAPLTSRTIQFISQTTITAREVNSNPNITDTASKGRGPGFVAPVGNGAHFPPRVFNTPPVDLFAIEHTNRDSSFSPGPDRIKGTPDDIPLPARFNANPAFIPPGAMLTPPDSYGFVSGLMPGAQPRGIGTLPGGIPLFKNGTLVGGIGVFFPGTTGFASAENSALSATFKKGKRDRSLEAEWMAFAAAGGSSGAGAPVGAIGGQPPVPGFDLPFGRIDLAGITLDIYGPGGNGGVRRLVQFGSSLGVGNPAAATFQEVNPGPDGVPGTADDVFFQAGQDVPDGWLVLPHDGVGITAGQVQAIIQRGIDMASITRAQIRLPVGARTRMVFAVADLQGNVVGLFRMPDATVFSIDVAVAKARNVSYYTDPNALQAVDKVKGIPAGTALTARTFRFLAGPRLPEGVDNRRPGPFSILLDPKNGPASAYQHVLGYDAFNPETNFRDQRDPIQNQSGIVFFPGSQALFTGNTLLGGFGVSGDGVDQDDSVTFTGGEAFAPPAGRRADRFKLAGARLPYFKLPRNPLA
jgi:uncharacterized protein GlcG (DUF336 family)